MKKIVCITSLTLFLLVGSLSAFADPHTMPDTFAEPPVTVLSE